LITEGFVVTNDRIAGTLFSQSIHPEPVVISGCINYASVTIIAPIDDDFDGIAGGFVGMI
jgi:hypothetical protein